MRNVVFPRAAEEARELFRAGQRQGAKVVNPCCRTSVDDDVGGSC